MVGAWLVGFSVGESEGDLVGAWLVGFAVGENDGDLVGAWLVGFAVGENDGDLVGAWLVGFAVGENDGDLVGAWLVGFFVGEGEGDFVGDKVGVSVTVSLKIQMPPLVDSFGPPTITRLPFEVAPIEYPSAGYKYHSVDPVIKELLLAQDGGEVFEFKS